MSWRTIVINEHAKISYQNGSLVYKSNTQIEKIHISEIHTVICETTNINITTGLIYKLIESNVKVIFCDSKRNPQAELVSYYGTHDSSRKIAIQLVWNDASKSYIWTEIIRQKISNQQYHLEKLGLLESATQIAGYLSELQHYDENNREGHAAKIYFHALFGKEFSREQENNINAFLDYGYTLILSVVNREISKNGQLTQIGLKHSNYFNPFNLSSDLMEPFRIIVDELVYEYQNEEFAQNKYRLLEMFQRIYTYNKQKMYLTNIIEHYVKNVLKCLDTNDLTKIPVFIFE